VLDPALPPGRAAHAYLFVGPAGSGKRTVARAFAAALLADGAADATATAERVRRGVHPDLTWVRPSGAAEMLVSDVDEAVVAASARTPFEALRRVFVIEDAQAMNDQAAARLLKTLEEPPDFAHLILLAERAADVLPTIASRCQHVRFDPLPAERIAQRLVEAGVPTERAEACARLALGDARRAHELASDAGEDLRAGAEAFARAALRPPAADAASAAADKTEANPDPPYAPLLNGARKAGERARTELEQRLEDELQSLPERERRRGQRERTEQLQRAERRGRTRALDASLRLTGLWLRDVACVGLGAPDLVHATDRRGQLQEDAKDQDPVRLRHALELVEDTRLRLQVHVSEELALEALGYRLERTLRSTPPIAGRR
jgi:DNA polymerase-3 subunit delta'